MNTEQKRILDEQSQIIENLSPKEIHQLLAGLPPLEAGDFFSINIQNEYAIVNSLFDSDALTHKLKTRVAESSKIEKTRIREYMKEFDLSQQQAKALIVMQNQYLSNFFSETGMRFFIEWFQNNFEESFNNFVNETIKSVLEKWRNSSRVADLTHHIDIAKLPDFKKLRHDMIQSQQGGRPVGSTKDRQGAEGEPTEKEFFKQLLIDAAVKVLRSNKNNQLSYAKLGSVIVELQRNDTAAGTSTGSQTSASQKINYAVKPVGDGQKVITDPIPRQKVHYWFQTFGLDIMDIDDAARRLINKNPK